MPPDAALKVVKPLYGIPESGLHWYLTYLEQQVGRLGIRKAKIDPCVLLRNDKKGKLGGMVILQVDDSLAVGSTGFLKEEEAAADALRSEPRVILGKTPQTFKGIRIRRDEDGTILVDHAEKISKLSGPDAQASSSSHRELAQYIGINCRPDKCPNVQLIAPGNAATTLEEFKLLRKVIKHLRSTEQIGMKFVPLDLNTTRVFIVSGASFENAKGLRSQLGFLVMMVGDQSRENVVHFGSSRFKRITRSVMASQRHVLILDFDYGFVIRDALEEILNREVAPEVYTDSRTVLDVIAKDGKSSERRLEIDICALLESYARGELDRIG